MSVCLQVKKVLNSGACSKDGRIHSGDRLVAIEGHELRGVSHSQCISLLQEHSRKEQVTLKLLRQSKQDDPDTLNGNVGDFTNSQSSTARTSRNSTSSTGDVNNVVQSKDGAYESGYDDDSDTVLSNGEIDHEQTTKLSPVHHNQIFAQQHVKLAYARNSFRVKKNRQIPKIPKDEYFNRSDDNNSNKSSQSDTSNTSDVSANSSDTEHERLTGLSKHQTIENLNKIHTLDGEKQADSETSDNKETNEDESIGTENEDQLISQDQRAHTSEIDVNKNYEGSSYMESSDLYISGESGYVGDETLSTIQSDNTEVTITRVEDYKIPKGYQRYEMSRSAGNISVNNNIKLNVIDSDSEMEGTDLLLAAPDKVQELLATTPPRGDGFVSTMPPSEAPPSPPPGFSTDDDSCSEAPALPIGGPPAIPPPTVPRTPSPTSVDSDNKEQSREEVSKDLSDKMKFLDQILNDDTLPVTNIDDLLDDDDDYMDNNVNTAERRQDVDPHSNQQVESETFLVNIDSSKVLSPQTSADIKHALVNPFEELEKDFDNDEVGASDLSSHNGTQVTMEGMSEGLCSAHGSDMVDHRGYGAAVSGDSNSCGDQFEVEGIKRVSDLVILDTSVVTSMIPDAPIDPASESGMEYHHKGATSTSPSVQSDAQVKVFSFTVPLEQAQLQAPLFHVGSHYDQQQNQPSSGQHDTFVFSSHAESNQFTELEHNFGTAIDSNSENVTVVRITSPSISLQHLTPSTDADSDHEQQNESPTDTEVNDQPPPLPTTDIPHPSYSENSENVLVDKFTNDTDQLNSKAVGVVCFYDDQNGAGPLNGDLNVGVSDVHKLGEKLSTVTADTLSTDISETATEDDVYESNYTITAHLPEDPRSDILFNDNIEYNQINAKEQLQVHKTTVTLDETEQLPLNNTSQTSENIGENNNNTFNSKSSLNFKQSSDHNDESYNANQTKQVYIDSQILESNQSDDDSNVVNIPHSEIHTEAIFTDANCLVDLSGQSINNFTEEISTYSSTVQSSIELKDSNTGNNEAAVEITPDNKCVTNSMNPTHDNVEEVKSNPASMYHTTQVSDAMKTTGDGNEVNAHCNDIDAVASENNLTANSSNQTVTDTLIHETPEKTISECGTDDIRGNRVNLSSMNDVQFDISSTEHSGGNIKSATEAIQDSAVDKEKSLSSTNAIQLNISETSIVPESSPELLSSVSESSTIKNDVGSKKVLPSLKLPKISTFESRKLTPVSPRSLNMKSTFTSSGLKSSSLSKIRNKRSEVEPFSVEVIKGLLGLGIKLNVTKDGLAQVVDIQKTGPIGRSAVIRLVFIIYVNVFRYLMSSVL